MKKPSARSLTDEVAREVKELTDGCGGIYGPASISVYFHVITKGAGRNGDVPTQLSAQINV